ncbi:hypothetical protein FPQ18DRAFT_305743 [Pyronema domesticum]|nr:hypothetical protein FPQ18DRAFT_305743 [Pyronema domesticum]
MTTHTNPILPFPNELWLEITQYLPERDILALRLTNRHFDVLFGDDQTRRGVTLSLDWKCCPDRPVKRREDGRFWFAELEGVYPMKPWVSCDCMDKSPLLWAIQNNKIHTARKFLSWNISANHAIQSRQPGRSEQPDFLPVEPWSLLSLAIFRKHPDMMRLLLDAGADIQHPYIEREPRKNLVGEILEPVTISPMRYALSTGVGNAQLGSWEKF